MIYCSIYLFLSWFIGLVNVTMAVQKRKRKKELNQEKRIKLFDYLIMGFTSSLGNGEG
jgi:predicted membrane channel-forming protein YqfA (hemolysin III family)